MAYSFKNVYDDIVNKGGASYNHFNGSHNPKAGYMVAVGGLEKKYPIDGHFTLDKFAAIIRDYHRSTPQLADYLGNTIDETANMFYLGFWLYEGRTLYVDIAENLINREHAITIGKRNQQIAIFDCANKCDITL